RRGGHGRPPRAADTRRTDRSDSSSPARRSCNRRRRLGARAHSCAGLSAVAGFPDLVPRRLELGRQFGISLPALGEAPPYRCEYLVERRPRNPVPIRDLFGELTQKAFECHPGGPGFLAQLPLGLRW